MNNICFLYNCTSVSSDILEKHYAHYLYFTLRDKIQKKVKKKCITSSHLRRL